MSLPRALIIAAMVAIVTVTLAVILSQHEPIDSQLFTVLITAGVVGLVNIALDIIKGPTVPAPLVEKLIERIDHE